MTMQSCKNNKIAKIHTSIKLVCNFWFLEQLARKVYYLRTIKYLFTVTTVTHLTSIGPWNWVFKLLFVIAFMQTGYSKKSYVISSRLDDSSSFSEFFKTAGYPKILKYAKLWILIILFPKTTNVFRMWGACTTITK